MPAERAIDREVRIDEGHWLSIGRLGAAGGIVLTAVREAGGAPRYGVEGSGKQAERLKSDERQNNRPRKGALGEESWGEAPQELVPGAEWLVAQQGSESPAKDEPLIEEGGERGHCKPALAGVEANQGSAGVGRMTVQRLREFLKQRWRAVREELLRGTDKPQQGGGRTVGIPRELDRFLQPAVMQSLQRKWAGRISEPSNGLRPGRMAHQAVESAQRYLAEGYRWVVGLELEKFLGRVNHDKLRGRIAQRMSDPRRRRRIRTFLTAGGREDGFVRSVDEGKPPGGPFCSQLSKLVPEEWDGEGERRGLRFAGYADDCTFSIRSRRSGGRLMASATHLLVVKLELRVTQRKSAAARPWEREFGGGRFTGHRQPKRRIARQGLVRFKGRIRELRSRSRGARIVPMAEAFRCEAPSELRGLEDWTRRLAGRGGRACPVKGRQFSRPVAAGQLTGSCVGAVECVLRLARGSELNRRAVA